MKTLLAALFSLAVIPPQAVNAAPPPDPATPKGVLYAFGDAIAKNDMAAAKALTPGTVDDQKLVDLFSGVGAAQKKVHAAAEKKFGKDEITTVGGNGSSVAAERFKDSEKWEENIDGDTALLTRKPDSIDPPGRPNSRASQPAKLRRVSGVWKLDLAGMVPADKRDQYCKALESLTTVNNELADEISADKYDTSAAAKTAYQSKMITALRTLRPTTRPVK